MTRTLTFILFMTLVNGCVPKTQNPPLTDDYVLVEFAARLEEHHNKIYPVDTAQDQSTQSTAQ